MRGTSIGVSEAAERRGYFSGDGGMKHRQFHMSNDEPQFELEGAGWSTETRPCSGLPTSSQAGWHGASMAELLEPAGRSPANRRVARSAECGERINRHNPLINAVLEINPDALEIAKALDHERNTCRSSSSLSFMRRISWL